ncbi:hypothetical protein C8J57DRAFT_1717893 [Mycena rebaudengoi]|nr:hypothetical protein C8J57DRAFT_1717893 [Mycena rebaudengoi]
MLFSHLALEILMRTITLVEPTDDASPAFQDIRESNVTAVYDVVPTDMAQYGGYTDAEDSSIHYSVNFPVVCLMTHSSFVILRNRVPQFRHASVLYQLLCHPRCCWEVDYGPISGTQNQHVDWLKVADFPRDSESYRVRWLQLLTQKDKSPAEVLEDVWMGPGNLWVFVRPDCFPIPEALAFAPLARFEAADVKGAEPTLDTMPSDLHRRFADICRLAVFCISQQ